MAKPNCLDIAQAAGLEPERIRGNELFSLCPRHDDHDPRLRLNPAKQGFSCKPCNVEEKHGEFAAFLTGVNNRDMSAVAAYPTSLKATRDAPYKIGKADAAWSSDVVLAWIESRE